MKKWTPVDIYHKTFSNQMLGYSKTEVQDFLRELSEQFKDTIIEKTELMQDLQVLKRRVFELQDKESFIEESIREANEIAAKVRADAEREAKIILTQAQTQGQAFAKEARESLKKSYQELAELKKYKLQFETNLKALVQAHLTLIESGRQYQPEPINSEQDEYRLQTKSIDN